jgi:hypothetical protein
LSTHGDTDFLVEFLSDIKKNEIMSSAGKWMELELIMLSEISHSHKDKYCVFFLIWNPGGKMT